MSSLPQDRGKWEGGGDPLAFRERIVVQSKGGLRGSRVGRGNDWEVLVLLAREGGDAGGRAV